MKEQVQRIMPSAMSAQGRREWLLNQDWVINHPFLVSLVFGTFIQIPPLVLLVTIGGQTVAPAFCVAVLYPVGVFTTYRALCSLIRSAS